MVGVPNTEFRCVAAQAVPRVPVPRVPMDVWSTLSDAAKSALNQAFLDAAVQSGARIILATSVAAAQPGTWFYQEIQYLFSLGYSVSQDGTMMLPPVP